MPDHVHGLVSLPATETLAKTVGDWKRFTARRAAVEWQDNFFDHRLRSGESLDEKATYIRANPFRAGLVKEGQDWPWVWTPGDIVATPE
jgi:REP element-mobilizing transposase RayT